MNNKQKIERMHYILKDRDFMPEISGSMKNDAINLIERVVDDIKDLSMRTLVQVIRIREANPNNNWERLAEYAITN